MVPTVKEWRHLLLIGAIIAVLPLLTYPNSLGLNFQLGMVWYIILELIYFYAMFRLLNPDYGNRPAVLAMLFSFVGRLSISAVFMLLLMILGSVKPAIALSSAFGGYKPALLLFSLTAPVILNSIIKVFLSQSERTRRRPQRVSRTPVSSPRPFREMSKPAPERSEPEFFDLSFAGAVRHVGGYSGVISSLLIDEDGLLIAEFSRDHEDGEMWAGLAVKIVAEISNNLDRAGLDGADWLEFAAGDKRINLLRVQDMWLMSISHAATDELEKIRMQQAAEMVGKHYRERYFNLQISKTENSYAGSTVGA
jgi:predicted regulator of Ras-like GTPase activity (Roadblock/LC7/MglB family)